MEESELVLERDADGNNILCVDKCIAEKLKQHQIEGVRFLWESCFVSLHNFQNPSENSGGCILAHCMGLGNFLKRDLL